MTEQNTAPTTTAPAERPELTPKKPYETPVLTVHGTVAQITASAGPPNGDGMGGSLFLLSDRAVKQNFAPVDAQDVLARLLSVPVTSWAYNAEPSTRHIGPMAQDFMAAFGVGDSDKHIHMIDANGVAMAAIQALYTMIAERDAQIDGLRRELDELKQRLAA